MRKRILQKTLGITTLLVTLVAGQNVLALDNSGEWPKTDFTNSSVDFSEILSGGPPKDGIRPPDGVLVAAVYR